jgi:hypothetical protein
MIDVNVGEDFSPPVRTAPGLESLGYDNCSS